MRNSEKFASHGGAHKFSIDINLYRPLNHVSHKKNKRHNSLSQIPSPVLIHEKYNGLICKWEKKSFFKMFLLISREEGRQREGGREEEGEKETLL